MIKRIKPSKISTIDILFDQEIALFVKNESTVKLDFLIELVGFFRPKNKFNKSVSIRLLIDYIKENPSKLVFFKEYLAIVFSKKKITRMLSNSGILQDSDFLFEIKKRIFAKLLPHQPEKDTLEYVLNQVFYKDTDSIWINKIANNEIFELFELLNFHDIYFSVDDVSPLREMLSAMSLISQRMSGRAMEDDVLKMVPEFEQYESPFAAFEKELLHIETTLKTNTFHYITDTDINYKQLVVLHKQCEDYVEQAFKNSSKFGISLKVNQSLLRIRQQLDRVKNLFPFLIVNDSYSKAENSINLFKQLVQLNCIKNNVSQLINQSTQLISYEITQHTAKTGEHYITESKKEYFGMFKSALGGGFIVGILCVIKMFCTQVETSNFGHAFLYSLNYALGFIAIYLFGFTLATKQPAMTASTIIQVLENDSNASGNSKNKHKAFAQLFARLFRSQFIAFVGNILMAFPVSLGIIYSLELVFDYNFAENAANKFITDLNPVLSLSILHAAIAGFFLFLSGLISGNVSNKNKHHKVYYRLQEHPLLKKTFGISRTIKISKWFENNWAGIVSNAWLGIFLGSTASIGLFFGLNLDIRHITFASGNFALGVYGNHFFISNSTIIWSILGISIIGFINFMVSFLLSLGLAFRSRNIPVKQLFIMNKAIWKHFIKKPLSFFIPLKEQ